MSRSVVNTKQELHTFFKPKCEICDEVEIRNVIKVRLQLQRDNVFKTN